MDMDRRTFNRGIAAAIGLAGVSGGALIGLADPTKRPATKGSTIVIDEGFEGAIPDFYTYQATYAADSTRAHSGKRSLRVTPAAKQSGGAYFHLDGVVDLSSDYEFSAWVYASTTGAARLYISASDGKRRHTKAQAAGGKAGEWQKLTGTLRAEEWNKNDREIMLAMTSTGECWFDDVVLRKTRLPDPPIETYPLLLPSLQARADRHASTLTPGGRIELDARSGILAIGPRPGDIRPTSGASVPLPADSLLIFAIDVPRPLYASGRLDLEPDADLRPGLRATVLCDTTILAAPMVRAAPWQGVGNPLTGPAPACLGTRPAPRIELTRWLVPAGRHYLFVAAPHFRGGGTFRKLVVNGSPAPVRPPLHTFALLSDTHFGSGRSIWMNTKMNAPAREQLGTTLAALRRQGTAYAILAGDMTDGATREQFAAVGRVCRKSGLPVYGCIGNHDAYHASSRPDALELCAAQFPGGRTDYVLEKPPLRFVVMDGSYWKSRTGTFMDHYDRTNHGGIGPKPEQVDWLRNTLAADTHTPTVFVWHYPLFDRTGPSSCGFRVRNESLGPDVLAVIERAPNVVAALCGHTHWNEANLRKRQSFLINPAYCEWPNAYRVFRVYPDRIEWELRQVANRGFEQESFIVPKALSWMISTAPDDLGGQIQC